MPYKEDILREKTYKDQCEDVEHRVFYTLNDGDKLQLHRVTHLLASIVGHLQRKGLLKEEELDEMLLQLLG